MPRGQKTSPEVIYQIMTSWAINSSYAEVSRETGVPLATVKRIIQKNKNKDEFVELCDAKRVSFAEKAESIIDKALERLSRELDNYDKDIPVNHLVTIIDKIYDKKALAEGKTTDNVSVSIKLPEGIEDYAG